MRNLNITPLDAVDASVTQTSGKFSLLMMNQGSVSGVVSGGSAPSGTLTIQFSNAKPPDQSFVNIFVPPENSWFSGDTGMVTDDGVIGIQSIALGPRWGRLKWTPTSAAGATLTATFNGSNQGD